MDPDPDPGGSKTYGFCGSVSGSAALPIAVCRLFAAFLDHGPQFVLRLVIVVLNGIAHNGVYHRGLVFIFKYSLRLHKSGSGSNNLIKIWIRIPKLKMLHSEKKYVKSSYFGNIFNLFNLLRSVV